MTYSYLAGCSLLALELGGPEGLLVATRHVLGHAVVGSGFVGAALRLIQLECASAILDTIIGIHERVDNVARDPDLGATSGLARPCGELLVVEERRDGGVSVVALIACE
jgi:hypothetical protein